MSTTSQLTRRSKNGCQQCRQRKKKCDERHPNCTACSERSLQCNWEREEPNRRRQMARRRWTCNQNFMIPREMRPLVTIFTVPSTPTKERLLSHFWAASPLWITVGGYQSGVFCRQLIMAGVHRNPLVLDCVLAVAAGDMSKYQPASSELTSLTHGFYGQAVMGIRSALSEPPDEESRGVSGEDDVLLAILLLCVHESVNFSNAARIIPHINAAATLCHSRSFSTTADTKLRGLLFEMFCYFFALTAFSYGRHLELGLALPVFNSPFLAPNVYRGVLLDQQSREIFLHIHTITMLLEKAKPRVKLNADETTQLRDIEERLARMPVKAAATDDPDQHSEITTELFRLACSIYVKRILYPGLASRSIHIQELVAEFITYLNVLPVTSNANSTLCWPLVVVGLSSTTVTHQRLIIGRLRRLHETWRSDNISLSADMLAKVWREERVAEDSDDPAWTGDAYSMGSCAFMTRKETLRVPILIL